jgi:hypothetical protein
MATYKEIQSWVKQNYGFVPKTCWITDMNEKTGLLLRRAHNWEDDARQYPIAVGDNFTSLPAAKSTQISN